MYLLCKQCYRLCKVAKIFKVEVLWVRQMKDSGIEWIGEIPENWNTKKGKFIFKQRNSRGNDIELQLLSPTQKYGVIPQSMYEQLSGMKAVKLDESTDFALLKTVHKGDYCISLRSFQGGFEFSEYDGVVSPAYQVFYPVTSVDRRYFKYMFKDKSFIDKMNSYTMSLRDGKNIAYSDFADSYLPIPPIQIQSKIAAALDYKCTEIDNAIAKTTASIEEYKKLKQSIITKAVTKGICGNRPMKDSGIEWIGEIPADWEIVKLKYCTYIRARLGWKGLKAEEYKETGYPLLSAFNIINSKLSFDDVNYINQERYDESPEIKLKENDLLLVKDGAGIGKCAIVDELPIPSTTNGSLAVISVTEWLYSKFLYYFFLSKIFQKYIDRLKDGMGVPHLFQSDLKNIKIVFPDENEQKEIISYLDYKCSEIDEIIDNKQQLITELEAYKKSLIYEYVTGKKEVV